jgi:uncharacterized RDD family membrane protein YckC
LPAIALKGAPSEETIADLYMTRLHGPLFELTEKAKNSSLGSPTDWLSSDESCLDPIRWSGLFRGPVQSMSRAVDRLGAMPLSAQIARPKFWVRLLALLVDYGLILGYMAVLALTTLALYAITGELFDWLSLGTTIAQLLGFLLLVLPVGVYLYVGEASTRQATVGKRVLGLQVVNAADRGRPTRIGIVIRTVVKLLPWEIAHFAVWNIFSISATGDSAFPIWLLATVTAANLLPFIYIATIALQKDGRGPHDLAAGTRVIVKPRRGLHR